MRAGLAIGAALVLAAAGCGGGSEGGVKPEPKAPSGPTPASTCARMPVLAIDAIVAEASGAKAPKLKVEASGSSALLACRYTAPGLKLHVNLDTASESRTRYQNRVTELAQFGFDDKKLAPHPVKGVGDKINGGGANWVPATDQLFTVEGSRYLIVDFYIRGSAGADLRDGAVALARLAFAKLPRD